MFTLLGFGPNIYKYADTLRLYILATFGQGIVTTMRGNVKHIIKVVSLHMVGAQWQKL